MSHQHDSAPKPCPNCGFPATHNYCAQCGQETHLHNDTFFGLIWHFIGHYFHYDSKFWKTIKTLWFAPGKLTKDYLEGKRARYIPPISLYIFVSAVFFLTTFLMPSVQEPRDNHPAHAAAPAHAATPEDSARRSHALIRIGTSIRNSGEQLQAMEEGGDLTNAFKHQLPKIFFFLIPFMAMMLRLLFIRRRTALFGQHAIFSLHVHSFFFSLFLIDVLLPFEATENITFLLLSLAFGVYFILALRRVYGVSYLRAILSSLVIGFVYGLAILICILVVLFLIARSGGGH